MASCAGGWVSIVAIVRLYAEGVWWSRAVL